MKIDLKLYFVTVGIFCLLTCLNSCADKTTGTNVASLSDTTGISSSGTMRFEGEIISVPSPIQVASYIHKYKIPYDESLLSSLQNREKFLNETKKALNLGVYGADLAYISNYNLGQICNDYFDALAGISTDLGILENIDKGLVANLNRNMSNRDSLLNMNASFFHSADNYLKSNLRPHISAYILIGGWIESLHLSTNAAKKNAEMATRLAEQKYSASSMQKLIEKFDDPILNPMKSKFVELCEAMNKLESTYAYRQPINDQREKITYLRSQTSVNMSEEQLLEIATLVKEVRNTIIE